MPNSTIITHLWMSYTLTIITCKNKITTWGESIMHQGYFGQNTIIPKPKKNHRMGNIVKSCNRGSFWSYTKNWNS